MSKEEKFKFDIENLKKNLAIEDMKVDNEDIELLRKYHNKEITMEEMINIIEKSVIQGV